MNKKLFSGLLLVLMVASMLLFVAGCGSDAETAADDSAARIAQLEQENAQLKAQLEELSGKLNTANEKAALQDWTLDVEAWSDGNGATVTFSATPVSYADGMRAALSVRVGELEAESTNCVWDGDAFTGSVELSAVDGYGYYCILTSQDGTQEEVALNTPDHVTDEMLVNLGSNLSAYANLVVEDWEVTASALTLKSGYIQVQMPRLTYNNAVPDITEASLVLKLNNEEVDRQTVTLDAGEGDNSFETTLSSLSFNMPAVEEDYQLDLWLDITLTSGSAISVAGGSWYSSNGDLQMVVG